MHLRSLRVDALAGTLPHGRMADGSDADLQDRNGSVTSAF